MHHAESVLENETHKLLWDFEIQTDHIIPTRRPYQVIIYKKKRISRIVCSPHVRPQSKIKRKRKERQIPNLFAMCDAKGLLLSQNGVLFRTCEDGAGWHLIPYRISPRSEFFSQAYKTWHITWGINLGPDWSPLARGSKFHTIHTPTRPLNFIP